LHKKNAGLDLWITNMPPSIQWRAVWNFELFLLENPSEWPVNKALYRLAIGIGIAIGIVFSMPSIAGRRRAQNRAAQLASDPWAACSSSVNTFS